MPASTGLSPRCLLVADGLDGGLGAAVREQAEWLRRAGWDVLVGAPDVTPGDGGSARIPIPPTARALRGMTAAASHLRRLTGSFQPDVVHCHGLRSFAAVRLAGIRSYLTVHGYGAVASDPLGYRFARAAGLRFAGGRALRAFSATPELGPPWTFVPHASPRLSTLAPVPLPASGPPTFVWLGRLDEPKRPDIFVRAVASVALTRPIRGVIAGGGRLEGSLRAMAEGLNAPVTFAGDGADVASLLSEAWAVVLFSGYEALSFALQEAMWIGRPVVASRLPSLEWLVGSGGVLVRSEGEAAQALTSFCDRSIVEETGRQAAVRVRELIHPGESWTAIEKVYRSCVA